MALIRESTTSRIQPVGIIKAFGGSSIPTGWLLCNGASVATASFPDLFAVIGYTYGGTGANFLLPDLTGRVPVGKNAGTFVTLGAKGGEETHTLTVVELAQHSHTFVGNALPTHGHTFTGSPLAAHNHFSFSANPGVRWSNNATSTGGSAIVNSVDELTGGSAPSTANPVTSINSAGTPAGTVDPISAGTPTGSNLNTGTSSSHNNIQPYLVTNFIIKS